MGAAHIASAGRVENEVGGQLVFLIYHFIEMGLEIPDFTACSCVRCHDVLILSGLFQGRRFHENLHVGRRVLFVHF